jgi:SHS2 domain-containing protein
VSPRSCPAYEELDHTADVALRIRGANLADLVRNAALGMSALLCADPARKPDMRQQVEVRSDDGAALVVDWLNELLYLTELHQRIWRVSTLVEASETSVRAEVTGFACRRAGHAIKAATYHDLHLRRDEQDLTITIIFDV